MKTNPPSLLTLQVIMSNGDPTHDVKLKFEFEQRSPGHTQAWLLKLPKLANPDGFPRLVKPGTWELRLDAVSDTQPMEVLSFTPENVPQWLHKISHRSGALTEILIFASHGAFTVATTVF